VRLPNSLFARTALTITGALLLFILLTGLAVFRYILMPVGQQGADDLGALIVLSAQTWAELPPQTRPDFVTELQEQHHLLLRTEPPTEELRPLEYHPPFMRFLETALQRRLNRPVHLHQQPDDDTWFWAPIPIAGRVLYLGFSHDRIGARPPLVLLLLLLGAGLFILLTTLLLVRLINRPLNRLNDAVRQLGRQGFSHPLPENGPTELAQLARKFNELSGQIQRLLENRTTLLGGISHDLRTPLARMALAMELLQGKEEPELLERMKQDLSEMEQLIARTLELAGLMQQPSEAAPEAPVDELLHALVEAYRNQGHAIDLRLATDDRRSLPIQPLKRILGNLLDNALRYAPDGPITLTATQEEGRLHLCVEDRGPGIPEGALEAVLQPFHRLEPSRSSTTGGSGLGLAIVRQLAELHDWRIELSNRSAGGLRACVVIP